MAIDKDLEESRLRLALAVDAARLGVFESEIGAAAPRWENARMYELFGRDPARGPIGSEEFLGEVLHRDDVAPLTQAFERAFASARPVDIRVRVRRQSDGAWRWLQFNANTETDATGAPRRVVGVVADVTEAVAGIDRLTASEARYRRLFDTVTVGVVLVRRDGGFFDFNPAACEVLGYTREEFARTDVPSLQAETPREAVLARLARVLDEPGTLRFETRLRAKDGSVHDVLAHGHRVDIDGEPLVCGIWTDITAQQAAARDIQTLLRRQALALDAAALGWWEWTPGDRLAYWSDALYRIFGLPPGAGVEPVELFLARVHPDDLDTVQRVMTQASWDERMRTEHRIVRPDGQVRWLVNRGTAIRDEHGRVTRLVGVCVDLTERKQLELELTEASRRKDEFLSMLAHELRNPLAPVLNSVTLLKHAGADAAIRRAAADTVERQVRHLSRIVDDLLDVARISRGRILLRREPTPVAKVVADAIDVVAPLLDSRDQRLVLNMNARVDTLRVDPTRMTQVVGNLLNNASKFSPPGSEIRLDVSDTDDEVVLAVSDRGEGLTADELAVVFQLFVQGDNSLERSRGGLGIGLALVKSLTELHGGSVAAASAGRGHGATFTVRLPRAAGERGLPEATRSGEPTRQDGSSTTPRPPGAAASVAVGSPGALAEAWKAAR